MECRRTEGGIKAAEACLPVETLSDDDDLSSEEFLGGVPMLAFAREDPLPGSLRTGIPKLPSTPWPCKIYAAAAPATRPSTGRFRLISPPRDLTTAVSESRIPCARLRALPHPGKPRNLPLPGDKTGRPGAAPSEAPRSDRAALERAGLAPFLSGDLADLEEADSVEERSPSGESAEPQRVRWYPLATQEARDRLARSCSLLAHSVLASSGAGSSSVPAASPRHSVASDLFNSLPHGSWGMLTRTASSCNEVIARLANSAPQLEQIAPEVSLASTRAAIDGPRHGDRAEGATTPRDALETSEYEAARESSCASDGESDIARDCHKHFCQCIALEPGAAGVEVTAPSDAPRARLARAHLSALALEALPSPLDVAYTSGAGVLSKLAEYEFLPPADQRPHRSPPVLVPAPSAARSRGTDASRSGEVGSPSTPGRNTRVEYSFQMARSHVQRPCERLAIGPEQAVAMSSTYRKAAAEIVPQLSAVPTAKALPVRVSKRAALARSRARLGTRLDTVRERPLQTRKWNSAPPYNPSDPRTFPWAAHLRDYEAARPDQATQTCGCFAGLLPTRKGGVRA